MKILWDGVLGKPEPLKNNLSGWWSRQIDDVNRIVYKEKDGAIIIASCMATTSNNKFI